MLLLLSLYWLHYLSSDQSCVNDVHLEDHELGPAALGTATFNTAKSKASEKYDHSNKMVQLFSIDNLQNPAFTANAAK